MNGSLSVIVPVYNVEKYLKQCITSITQQTYRDLEIILVNDGSTDESRRICDEFAAKDPRLVVIHQPNGGVSVARNTGIREATGEYLTFVDSDDWLEPEMYESMFAQIKKNSSLDMVMCDSTLIKSNSEIKNTEFIRNGYYSKSEIIANIYPVLLVTEDFGKIPIVSIWNCLMRRSVLVDNQIRFVPSLQYAEDYLFMAHVMISINSYYYLKGSHFYNYRQYELSRSKKIQPDWWSNFLELNKRLEDLLIDSKEFDFERQLKMQLVHSALFLSTSIYNNNDFSRSEKIMHLQSLFKDPHLTEAFVDLKFYKQSQPLKLVLYLIKRKMTLSYFIYQDIITKIKHSFANLKTFRYHF